MPIAVDREQLCRWRLAKHHLAVRAPAGLLPEVCGRIGVRNTPAGNAALALHARLEGLSGDAVENGLYLDETLVEVLGMRGNFFVVPVGDAAVFTRGSLPADEQSLHAVLGAPSLDKAGITATAAMRAACAAAAAALAGGPLTRGALSAAMTSKVPKALSGWCTRCESWHVLERAFRLTGVAGVFCVAPRTGRELLLVRADQRLGYDLSTADRASARLELLRRYLAAYGPSDPDGFAEWAGISPDDASRSWRAVQAELAAVTVAGRQCWVLADEVDALVSAPAVTGVRFLPPNDPYLLSRDHGDLVPDETARRQVWGGQVGMGALLVDGRLLATWRSAKKGRRMAVTVEPFAPLPRGSEPRIEAEAEGMAAVRRCTTSELTFRGA